jgi:hypothetical protein
MQAALRRQVNADFETTRERFSKRGDITPSNVG